MREFTASHLSEGNHVFPNRIGIDSRGVTLVVSGVFEGKSTTVPYDSISSVEIECPLIGFSSITISAAGYGVIHAHGFSEEDVNTMKDLILSNLA